MSEMKIPSDEQVQAFTDYLNAQARFHQWQLRNIDLASRAPPEWVQEMRTTAVKQANLCEGWAMALPEMMRELRMWRGGP